MRNGLLMFTFFFLLFEYSDKFSTIFAEKK